MKQVHSGTADAFDHRSRRNSDPYRFARSEYERSRDQSTMGALSRKSYPSAFEPGCSTGELTAQLARVCEYVRATDISQAAVECARARCAHLKNVEILCADISAQLPTVPVDLIVFSEIGYYFPAPQLVRIACSLASRLVSGGEFVAVHGLDRSTDHVLHGDAVHCQLLAHVPLRWVKGERHDGFRIDTWQSA
jgi:SAM-dependent methyltransferase